MAARDPAHPSLPSPPVAIHSVDELQVRLTGVLTTAERVLAVIVVGIGAETAICVEACTV